jgi:hypothetical protein
VARRLRLLPDDPDIGTAPYIWLSYLVFVFLGPVFAGNDDSVGVWIWSVLAVAVFLVLYRFAYWTHGMRLLACALGM